MKTSTIGLMVSVTGLVAACGGNSPPPAAANDAPPAPSVATTPPTSATSPVAAPASTTASTAATSAPSAPAAANAKDYDDPEEVAHGATITLTPLVQKGAKTNFPKKSVGDKECWQGASLQGDAKKDFDVLINKCGTPTGLVEYAKPVTGKLHHVHDKRDTYKLKLLGGMCYRYFAVADSGIKDLDILVTKPNGALVADDKTSNPVAIIEFDKSWCMDDDGEYDFHVEVDGEGNGHYMFGVWVKPKGK